MTPTTDPIDRTHAESLAAVRWIRHEIARMKAEAAAWTPRPYRVRVRG